jgi:pimeloyl-ACP methyl ester carboxylesterase
LGSCSWSLGGCVGYGLLADHSDKIHNIIIAAGSPGGPDAFLPPFDVVDKLATIGQNYSALLPLLFPKGVEDEGKTDG